MKYSNYLSINFFLSIIGIYLSYFYFGTRTYFYPKYLTFEIFKSAIILSILFTIVVLLTKRLINRLLPKIISNFFESILFGSIFFFIYFYTIRFSDLNYESIYLSYFTDQNILFKLSYYSFPFLSLFL